MPPTNTTNLGNADSKIMRNKIALGVVLVIVILIVVSLLSLNKKESIVAPVASVETKDEMMARIIKGTTSSGQSILSASEKAEIAKSSSSKNKNVLSEAEREAIIRATSGK